MPEIYHVLHKKGRAKTSSLIAATTMSVNEHGDLIFQETVGRQGAVVATFAAGAWLKAGRFEDPEKIPESWL